MTANTSSIIDERFGSAERFRTLRGIRQEAQCRLSAEQWNFLHSGTGDETTLARNTRAFDEILWNTPLFAGVSSPNTGSRLFGHELSLPLLVAPFGGDAEFHPEGHLAAGRAAQRTGIMQMVPVASSFTLEEVAASSQCPKLFQMTLVGEVSACVELADRARQAGYERIVATYSPLRQWRERLMEDAFVPRVSMQRNFSEGGTAAQRATLEELVSFTAPRWSWQQVQSFIRECDLPVMVKGVQSPRDAEAALAAGADSLYVSNYGGRTVDRTPASIEVLPEVRAAAGPEVPIVLDSGIRRGSDIAAALALGADAVAAGRLIALGLAAAGEEGVVRTVELLRDELWTTLGHLGCSSVEELSSEVLYCRP
ncbi:alpha-hydroxy acid oxidase [Nesterenkonia alkaliphila]|uniref:Alpha-hydroxy-acid oxidizing enzyme n=1 Tax=Nesterenkonia alkaliphila TaxID=1463631 RepID=A0A7K1UML0_9MICC|nr:alpha-hydroxy acid oxidase [Nesterenkonia alkaliphila]MVT27719.1 alpha-hydroxy-acid oxidizing enzyme [Nesterenkonia alkaliphila]GFZ87686.1 alpha-hydroxy-acid oxidizing enzyme [Nesterenkonia alkaliphila]